MTNKSILDAFERMWQHVNHLVDTKVNSSNQETVDMIMSVSADSVIAITADKFSIIHGSVADVLAVLSENRRPIVKIKFISGEVGYDKCVEEYEVQVQAYGESLFASFVASRPVYTYGACIHQLIILSDGTLSNASMKNFTLS